MAHTELTSHVSSNLGHMGRGKKILLRADHGSSSVALQGAALLAAHPEWRALGTQPTLKDLFPSTCFAWGGYLSPSPVLLGLLTTRLRDEVEEDRVIALQAGLTVRSLPPTPIAYR